MSSGSDSEFTGSSNGRSGMKKVRAVSVSSRESSFEATSPLSSIPIDEWEGGGPRIPKENKSLSLRSWYEWVDYKVHEEFSVFRSHEKLINFASVVSIMESSGTDGIVHIECCEDNENVCHGREGFDEDFFYFYTCVFTDSHVKLPFDEMTMWVLVLNVAPTQFHPNSWVALQAFRLVCKMLRLTANYRSFLSFYCICPGNKVTWLSLFGQSKSFFLTPFTASYKHFFKVGIEGKGRRYFFDDESLKFPFYWTNSPAKYKLLAKVDDVG